MTNNPARFDACQSRIQERLRSSVRATVLCGLSDQEIDAIAFDSMAWVREVHADGIRDVLSVRREVKKRLKQKYGSIVVMILFTIIWEIIKAWLFD